MKQIDLHTHFYRPLPKIALLNTLPEEPPPENAYFSVGMHPWYLESTEEGREKQFELLRAQVQEPYCLAIGECGLDRLQGPDLEIQLFWLQQQAQLAEERNRPLIIHCVKAFDWLLHWLKNPPEVPAIIIHGFNKKPELMQQLIGKGCTPSFGEGFLSKEQGRRCLESLSPQQFFLETDHDEQASISRTYRLAADILSLPLEELERALWQRFEVLFLK